MEKQAKIGWIDSFRALMMFTIVFSHTIYIGALDTYVRSFPVPAFFFISGYLFRKKDGRFSRYLLGKIRTLMVPYWVFSLISIAVYVILGSFAAERLNVSIKTTEILPNILGMLYGNGATGMMKWNLPLWFLPCFFAASLLMYPLIGLLDRFEANGKKQTAFMAAVVLLAVDLVNYYILHIGKLPFGLENTFYLSFFFLIGYGVRRLTERAGREPGRGTLLIIGCVAVCIGFFLSTKINSKVNYVSSSFGSLPLFYVSALFSITGYVCLCKAIPLPFLRYLGQNTLSVLLMHKFPVVLVQMFFDRLLAEPLSGYAVGIVTAVVTCALCLLVAVPIRKICPFALGSRKN